jgi:thiosulfate reductase cytochrome b subunit
MPRRIKFFHPFAIRLSHWLNVLFLPAMVASGLQIFNAYPAFAERGFEFCCYPFAGMGVPHWARLGGWLAGGRHFHFFFMWLFVLNGFFYLAYVFASGEWRRRFFFPRDARGAWQMQLYYLRLRKEKPHYEMYNGLQKLSYTGVIALGALAVLTGLSIWKPVSLPFLSGALGGYDLARFWHFLIVWGFVGFFLIHVFMTVVVDRESLRSMIVGAYREKETDGA